MKNKKILKSLISIMLLIIMFFSSIPLAATSTVAISEAEHKQIIETYISQMKLLQSQISDITYPLLKDSAVNTQQVENRIRLINSDSEKLAKEIEDYLATLSGFSNRTRDVLLTFNIINYLDSSLYTLSLLLRTTDDAERLALFDEYFRLRLNALDSISILENILSKTNP